ncbi:phytoene/squalene synthase family protein [Nesterenkonia flava]|uniref:Squalene/phytoene synthase family protein n=1 Tax=Nesterenkonia flava TaxID=469799 RepID=A0ABU1FSA4_9MICC|nr:squalene/phytoene synthase family protein [Nesterenkonia flava]MDR5711503.1 squalene/phytoene synthase family protein [Nesterenkonia flava]
MTTTSLQRFSRAAESAASDVIEEYSTSFGLATRLLGSRHRQHVRNIYAMVRVADEIVDGVTSQAGLDAAGQRAALESYVLQTHAAMHCGYSSDLVLHAFAGTARASGIGTELTGPFFEAMRADLREAGSCSGEVRTLSDAEHQRYVYGSAEVVGLMCLRVFLRNEHRTPEQLRRLERGACALGAAFQNVNFLRDLAEDTQHLHRSYLTTESRLTGARKAAWVATIREQLTEARDSTALLPRDARTAVRTALVLFETLNEKIARTTVEELYTRRVRVSDPAKGLLAAREMLKTWREGAV